MIDSLLSNSYSSFIASFAFVLQCCKPRGVRAKPIPLKVVRIQRLSLRESSRGSG